MVRVLVPVAKRMTLLVALVLTLTLALHGTASAAVSSLTLDAKARLLSKTSAVATGTIVCPLGNEATVRVVITQASGRTESAGQGETTITCTGAVKTWAVTTNVVIGTAFKSGPAIAIFNASDRGEYGGDTYYPTQTQGITLGR